MLTLLTACSAPAMHDPDVGSMSPDASSCGIPYPSAWNRPQVTLNLPEVLRFTPGFAARLRTDFDDALGGVHLPLQVFIDRVDWSHACTTGDGIMVGLSFHALSISIETVDGGSPAAGTYPIRSGPPPRADVVITTGTADDGLGIAPASGTVILSDVGQDSVTGSFDVTLPVLTGDYAAASQASALGTFTAAYCGAITDGRGSYDDLRRCDR